jgi:hypothetical protein
MEFLLLVDADKQCHKLSFVFLLHCILNQNRKRIKDVPVLKQPQNFKHKKVISDFEDCRDVEEKNLRMGNGIPAFG